jgi:hypothetical protein
MNASIECNNMGISLLKAGLLSEYLETFEGATQLVQTIYQMFKPSLIKGFPMGLFRMELFIICA